MDTIIQVVQNSVAAVLQHYTQVDAGILRIRIPPDFLIVCNQCTSMYSLAHATDCPGCPA